LKDDQDFNSIHKLMDKILILISNLCEVVEFLDKFTASAI